MTPEERIAQLEQENAELRAQLALAYQQISQLTQRLQRVEGQVAKDSHNSSKPPSSDGPGRKSRRQSQRSEIESRANQRRKRGRFSQVIVSHPNRRADRERRGQQE